LLYVSIASTTTSYNSYSFPVVNSAYDSINSNSDDEWMCLFAERTLQHVRAPDQNPFIPPFNLIEIFFLIIPLEWWTSAETYQRINSAVMFVLYTPVLLVTAYIEQRQAKRVRGNRSRGESDDDTQEEVKLGACV